MSTPVQTIGFIGVGSMGRPMAARLIAAGYAVIALDANRQLADDFARNSGATAAASAAELAKLSDCIITMLPTSAIVESVVLGDQGVLAGLKPGTRILEMSSGVPTRTQALAESVQQAGGKLLDAPVSGGVPRAESGELAIMVGGDAEDVAAVTPILEAMGKSIVHTGTVGSAHAMKALNNLVSAGGFLIGIEALMIGQRFGLDPEVMVDVLNSSTGMNNSTQKKFKQYVLSRAFNSGFGLDLMVKDLSIATGIAAESATPAPFSTLCREMWASAGALLGKGQDHTAVAKLIEQLSQTELGRAK